MYSFLLKYTLLQHFSIKQHTFLNVGNTKHFLLLILYFQPKKVTKDYNEDNVNFATERQDTCTLFYHRAKC